MENTELLFSSRQAAQAGSSPALPLPFLYPPYFHPAAEIIDNADAP